MSKTTKPSIKSNISAKEVVRKSTSERNIKHFEKISKAEEDKIIKLYDALVAGEENRTIDIKMIVTEAFPKFEETIGEIAFAKVKKHFGIGCSSKPKAVMDNEIRTLLARLKTIENAQYYITGFKGMIKGYARKMLNAPEGMSDIVKAKIMKMFFFVLANNEYFFEDYYSVPMQNGRNKIFFSEEKAIANNKKIFSPEAMFTLYDMKIKKSEGYFYDMMVLDFKRMYLENQKSKNLYKHELEEMLKFAELEFDFKTEMFSSVNSVWIGATYGKVRNLKKKIFERHTQYPIELFCNKKLLEEKIDITDLYIIYKTLHVRPFAEDKLNTEIKKYRTLSGSKFVDKKQVFYEICANFFVADKAEAQRWIALFDYFATYDIVTATEFDGNGGKLPETKYYNTGLLFVVISYAMAVGYLDSTTMVIRDFEVADKLLAIEGAEEKFKQLKNGQIPVEHMREVLGIDEEFEKNVLHIEKKMTPEELLQSMIQTVIKFALNNGYAESEEEIDTELIKNVLILGNEKNIEKFSKGEISESELENKIGFEKEFAEAYFNTSKIDINIIEAKLQDIKKYRRKEQVGKSKLLISLYCYIVKNAIPCGPKNKPAKRNKGLKPEILMGLIA